MRQGSRVLCLIVADKETIVPSIHTVDSGVVYRGAGSADHFRNAYWGTVAQLDDGTLLAALDICHHMNSRDARSYCTLSTDGGRTWSRPELIWDGQGWDYPFHTTCRISKTLTGDIVGFMAIKDRSDPDGPHTNPDTGGMVDMEHAFVGWDAQRQTWSPPQVMARPIDWNCYECCHPVFAATADKWLLPTAFRLNWDGDLPFGHKAFAFVSHDAGRTWPEIVDVFDLSAQNVICWEQKQTRLADGRIFAACWAFNHHTKQNEPNRYTFSEDDGASYEPCRESPLAGQTCTPIGLVDNHILCIYRRLDRNGLWAHLARIDGTDWIPVTEQLIWGGDVEAIAGGGHSTIQSQKNLQFGFPTIIKLSDGDLFLVFWCVEQGLSNIRWRRLNIAW